MTKYCAFDTETSGLPNFRLPADDPTQPHLASVTFIYADEAGQQIGEPESYLIKPDGWSISPEITAINGLTTERCEAEGIPIQEVLDLYTDIITGGAAMVAFHAQFDMKVMRGELRRYRMNDLFEQSPNVCVMRACGGLGIQKAGKPGGFPKLSDAFRHFFPGQEQPKEHTSAGDALTALMVFSKLIEIGKAPAPAVHYAKEKVAG